MKIKVKFLKVCTWAIAGSAVALFSVHGVKAEGNLSKDAASKLIIGNTISGKHFKGAKNDSFIAKDGTVSTLRAGKPIKGLWKFKDDGAHCVKFEGRKKFKCLYVADMGGGKYEKRTKNGKAIIFFSVVEGKMEGL